MVAGSDVTKLYCSCRLTRNAFVHLRHSQVQNPCVHAYLAYDDHLKTKRQRAP